MALSADAISNLRNTLNQVCSSASGLPGVVGVAVGRDGQELFAHAAGQRGAGSDEAMNLDHVFWIASCTKVVTGIACMQLVEQGLLSLDDAAQVESLCPELRNIKVLQPDGSLVDKKRGITLRMLLSHTGQSAAGLEIIAC
jgi:CubicO group peptidase (beta-lactamase class C family)